jgi:DNA-binding transcriptional MerR regulator
MPNVKGYSLKEVAAQVGVVKATIVRWMETKKVKIPKRKNARGHYVFTEADLKKLLDYKEHITTDEN